VIERYKREAVFAELNRFCHHAGNGDFIEITDWHNHEGYDITISSKNKEERFSLTAGQYEALVHLMSAPRHETKVD
jgi:N-acetyl-anhydromuramyl-L-alanine amidase AmpD